MKKNYLKIVCKVESHERSLALRSMKVKKKTHVRMVTR